MVSDSRGAVQYRSLYTLDMSAVQQYEGSLKTVQQYSGSLYLERIPLVLFPDRKTLSQDVNGWRIFN